MNIVLNTRFYDLKETAERLGVDADTLILWNENNILKPTITRSGAVAYREEQIDQFLEIQKLLKNKQDVSSETAVIVQNLQPRRFSSTTVSVFVLSFTATVASSIFVLKALPNAKNNQNSNLASQTSILDPLSVKQKEIPIVTGEPIGNEFAANNVSYSETVFDYRGNIKEKSPSTDVLAATSFANGSVSTGVQPKQPSDLNLVILLLAAGLLSTPFIFKKRHAYSTNTNTGTISVTPYTDAQNCTDEQRILELNQKTDGTVVLCFQGQEYKVSKPELDSESDQFIERLMGLVTPNVKEIDYNAVTDEDIKLSAPLSKIVTRLGFVGLKRDLFFPRTSKNKVLFRKYLTQTDLTAMNLSPDQIKREFIV